MLNKTYEVKQLPAYMVAIIRKHAPKKPHRLFRIRLYGDSEEYL